MLRQVLLLLACASPIACDQLEPLIADSEPNVVQPHCAPPPEWTTALCGEGPSVANKTFYHYSPCRREGSEFLPSKHSMVKFEDLDVLVLAKGTDQIHAACYSRHGSCIAVGHQQQGMWSTAPQRSFMVSKDGTAVTDIFTGEVYTQQERDTIHTAVCVE